MVLGITGGVGCGKSTLVALLAEHYNAKLLIADEIGHRIMEPGAPAWQKIKEQFGVEVLMEDGRINRDRLAAVIYQDAARREDLNHIVHPLVLDVMRCCLKEWEREPLVVIETAILFETGCDSLCDQIWWVDAERETRISRLMNTRGYTREKAEAIMNSQLEEAEWEQRCSVRIDNNGDCEKLYDQLKELLGRP